MIAESKPPQADATETSPFHQIRHIKKRVFLETYAETGQVAISSDAAGISRTTPYHWRKNDAEFAESFEIARSMAADILVDEAFRRATGEVYRLKFDKDGKALKDPITGDYYKEHQYSDSVLIFLLKCLLPDQFGDRIRHEGPQGGAIQHDTALRIEHVDDWYPKREAQPTPTAVAAPESSPATDYAQQSEAPRGFEQEIASLRQSLNNGSQN